VACDPLVKNSRTRNGKFCGQITVRPVLGMAAVAVAAVDERRCGVCEITQAVCLRALSGTTEPVRRRQLERVRMRALPESR
jgi:hypothetical protein